MTQTSQPALREIGRAQRPFRGLVERTKLIEFAQGLNLRNPIFYDREAAVAAGHRDVVVAPGFMTAFTLQPRADKFEVFGIDESRALVGELEWRTVGVICAGDELCGQSVLTDVTRSDGRRPSEVLTIETQFRNQLGELVLVYVEKTFEALP